MGKALSDARGVVQLESEEAFRATAAAGAAKMRELAEEQQRKLAAVQTLQGSWQSFLAEAKETGADVKLRRFNPRYILKNKSWL